VRVAVTVAAADRERALAVVLPLAPQGLEERDGGREVELAVFADAGGAERARSALAALGPVAVTPVEPGWEDAWRAFHRPVRAGGLWIAPPWETSPAGAPSVVIDPGRAFGTGAHPTTRLCVDLLAAPETGGGSLVDVGCGSGVLAIAAARLGYGPLVAVDSDPVAVETTRANGEANGVVLDARLVDALREPIPAADVAVANVLLAPVEAILERLDTAVAITSGYLEGERPRHPGWSHVAVATLEGWAADVFRRAVSPGAERLPAAGSV
jgi:ribosomal protein L11 methyltransferase